MTKPSPRPATHLPRLPSAHRGQAALRQVPHLHMANLHPLRRGAHSGREVEPAARVRRLSRGGNGMGAQVRSGRAIREGGQVSGPVSGERVNLIYWGEATDLREMQARINEMRARMAELQQHYGYTWIGDPETGERRMRRE